MHGGLEESRSRLYGHSEFQTPKMQRNRFSAPAKIVGRLGEVRKAGKMPLRDVAECRFAANGGCGRTHAILGTDELPFRIRIFQNRTNEDLMGLTHRHPPLFRFVCSLFSQLEVERMCALPDPGLPDRHAIRSRGSLAA